MAREIKAKNPINQPKKGMKLHKHIALGGKPSTFDGANHDWATTKENAKKK